MSLGHFIILMYPRFWLWFDWRDKARKLSSLNVLCYCYCCYGQLKKKKMLRPCRISKNMHVLLVTSFPVKLKRFFIKLAAVLVHLFHCAATHLLPTMFWMPDNWNVLFSISWQYIYIYSTLQAVLNNCSGTCHLPEYAHHYSIMIKND